jgi:amino acid transporter
VLVWVKRGAATRIDLAPQWNWSTANSWAAIAYAMSGMELVGMMGAEIRDPERTLPRAGWIASGFSTLFYTTMTVALLVLLRPEHVSEMNGLAEGGEAAAQVLGAKWLGPAIAVMVLATGIGQFGSFGAAVSRLPFAAGVDQLLPAAFGKLHPRWGTPYLSILVLGGVASLLLVGIQLGDTLRAAYQTMVSLMVMVGFLPFIYIFGSAWKAGKKLSALSGWAVTALALVCGAAPTGEVAHVWLFEAKLAICTAAVIASAGLVYRRKRT